MSEPVHPHHPHPRIPGQPGWRDVIDEPDPVICHLLRNAVTLHAEDLMRTIGAMARRQQDVREWSPLIERDVRDLCLLAVATVAAGSTLPAGLDTGEGDPSDPLSAMDGLLASHEAVVDVLGQIVKRAKDPQVARVAAQVLDRREEESYVLRALGAGRELPDSERLVHGVLPKYQA